MMNWKDEIERVAVEYAENHWQDYRQLTIDN